MLSCHTAGIVHLSLAPNVALKRGHLPKPPHLFSCTSDLVLVPAGDHHSGPKCEQLLSDGLPNSGPTACDYGNFSRK